jgi:hypothetical protein
MKHKKVYEDGIHDISNDEYHSSHGFSRTQVMLINKSPYHFWYENIAGLASEKEKSDALDLGSAVHTMLLEPELFMKTYAVMPSINRRTTKGKEEYASFIQEHADKIVLTQEQYNKAYAMTHHVRQHDIVNTLLENALFEKSIYWTDEETGLQFKVRPDIWSNKMIVDLKTTKDLNPMSYSCSAHKYGYYLQCWMFFEACEAIGKPIDMFVHLVIEKEEPYVPAVFVMGEKSINFGREQFNTYKRKIKECMETDKWPAYKVQEI